MHGRTVGRAIENIRCVRSKHPLAQVPRPSVFWIALRYDGLSDGNVRRRYPYRANRPFRPIQAQSMCCLEPQVCHQASHQICSIFAIQCQILTQGYVQTCERPYTVANRCPVAYQCLTNRPSSTTRHSHKRDVG